MTNRPDIVRLQMPSVKVAHCILPPWRDGEVESVSIPGSVGVAFTHQSGATVRRGNGRASRRDVVANSVGLGGHEPIAWIDVDRPSDVLEITASQALRREIAEELRIPQHADLDDIDNWTDPVVHTIAMRFRAGLRGWRPLGPLEVDSLTRAAYAHVFQRKFGGRARTAGALDAARLAAVTDFVAANLHRDLSIAELAAVAALSPYHFARSFRRSTGLAPHRFVTAWRMRWAAERLKHSTLAVEAIAEEVGFSNLHHFRRLFRMQFGCSPAEFRS
jgi:AraC family transcriptional regulator